MSFWEWFMKKRAVEHTYFACDVPKEALGPAKELNSEISDTMQVESVLFADGTVRRRCPYYKRVEIDGEEHYRCIPFMPPDDIKEMPENIEKIIHSDYQGCKCKFDS